MIALERNQYILESLRMNKIVLVSDLSKEISVTEETIRRDLEKLEKQGIINRVHGGAYLREGIGNETPIEVREQICREEKKKLAQISASYIDNQDSVILDCSTTAVYIAKELVLSKKKVTIITNSLSVAMEVSHSKTMRLLLLGGELRSSTNSFYGDATLESLSGYYAGKVFISSAGISLKAGVTDYTCEEAMIRRKMMSHGKECFYVGDPTKIGRIAVNVVADLFQINTLITNQPVELLDISLKKELDRLRIAIQTENKDISIEKIETERKHKNECSV